MDRLTAGELSALVDNAPYTTMSEETLEGFGLTHRQAQVICLLYCNPQPCNLTQAARALGLSRSYMSPLRARGLRKLRHPRNRPNVLTIPEHTRLWIIIWGEDKSAREGK